MDDIERGVHAVADGRRPPLVGATPIKQFVRFGVAGVAGFVADAGGLYALLALGLDAYVARIFSFLFAVFVTWRINRRYTFADHRNESVWHEWCHYLVAMSFGGACNYGIYALLVGVLPTGRAIPLVALAAGSIGGLLINFCSAKFWVFGRRRQSFFLGSQRVSPAFSQAVQWLDGLLASRRLGLAFVTAAVPSCIFLALATPPFQTPDAPNHLFRAYQVSRGGLIGKHLPDSASGMIDSGIVAFAGVAVPVAFHHEQKWTRGQATRAADARLTHKEIAVSFVNTAPYPPLNYIPQALAFAVFGHGNVPLLRIYRLACLLNAVCAIMMTAIALRIARRTRPIIFVVALLPMTLSLTASVSQDATLIPLGFLIVAWADFLCSAREFIAPRTAVGLAVLIIAAAIARIPYVAFALLFFHPSLRMARSEGRYGLRRRLIYVGSASCIALGLYLLQTRLAGGVLREGTSMSEQMQYLFSHLSAIPGIAHQTIMTFVGFYFRSFVGALGWLDTYFPDHFYRIAAVAIMLTFIYGLLRRDPADLSRRAWLETGFGIVPFASASALIFFGLYTYWSPIGAPVVEGVQGRYFLPIFPVLGMAVASPVPSWINDGRYVSGARALIAAAILCFPVFNFCAIVQVVLERYYIG